MTEFVTDYLMPKRKLLLFGAVGYVYGSLNQTVITIKNASKEAEKKAQIQRAETEVIQSKSQIQTLNSLLEGYRAAYPDFEKKPNLEEKPSDKDKIKFDYGLFESSESIERLASYFDQKSDMFDSSDLGELIEQAEVH